MVIKVSAMKPPESSASSTTFLSSSLVLLDIDRADDEKDACRPFQN